MHEMYRFCTTGSDRVKLDVSSEGPFVGKVIVKPKMSRFALLFQVVKGIGIPFV